VGLKSGWKACGCNDAGSSLHAESETTATGSDTRLLFSAEETGSSILLFAVDSVNFCGSLTHLYIWHSVTPFSKTATKEKMHLPPKFKMLTTHANKKTFDKVQNPEYTHYPVFSHHPQLQYR